MSVTSTQVLRDAGATDADNAVALEVLAEATAYVTAYITDALVDATVPVPEAIQDAATLACATDLFALRKAPFGQQVLPDGTTVGVGIGLDPMDAAREKLRPWCMPTGFAFPADWNTA